MFFGNDLVESVYPRQKKCPMLHLVTSDTLDSVGVSKKIKYLFYLKRLRWLHCLRLIDIPQFYDKGFDG